MAIRRIQRKEYEKIQWLRKNGGRNLGLYFKGHNGKYYQCDGSGMMGAKEIAEFLKEQKQEMREQTNLLDLTDEV